MTAIVPDMTQYGESVGIDRFFGDRIASALDIGSHAGLSNSNTLALFERGWSGVCVEPSPSVFTELLKTHADRPDIKCLNAAIAAQSKVVKFWDACGDQLSTADPAHLEKWQAKGYPFREMFLCTVTFDQLLAVFDGPFAFLNIDCEGMSLEVLRAAPIERMGVELVCVEKDAGVSEEIKRLGLRVVYETGGNLLAAR